MSPELITIYWSDYRGEINSIKMKEMHDQSDENQSK